MVKKSVCFLLVFLMVFTLALPLKAEANTTTSIQKPSSGNVQDRINQLIKAFPEGSSYFTVNGKACTAHPQGTPQSCNNCEVSRVMTQRLKYPDARGIGTSWTCAAFARFAFWYIFGISITYQGPPAGTTTRINDPKALRKGDFVVFSGHYGIYLEKNSKGENLYYHSNVPAGTSKISYKTTCNKTFLYALRPKSPTVTFDANGGTLPANQRTRTVFMHSQIGTLPTPTRSGYTFSGWYTAKTGGSKISPSTLASTNKTYFAQWSLTPPVRPASPKATVNSSSKITVSWSRVSNASGYQVQRSTKQNGPWTTVTTIKNGTTTSFANTGLSRNTQYYYRIRAYRTVGNLTAYSTYTATISAKTRLLF